MSTFIDYFSSPAFQNKYGFQKGVWNSENGLYKKNQLLSHNIRLHKVYSRYTEVII